MLRWRLSSDPGGDPGREAGSAALEFILVGLILLVPLVYLVVTLGLIQGQSLGVAAAARSVARVAALGPDATTAARRADSVLATVVAEYGLDPANVHVDMRCRPAGGACPRAGATAIVTVTAAVRLPLAPAVLGMDRWASVTVEASAAQRISRLWGAG